MLFLLQKTVKSLQRHLHEFLDELSGGQLFEPLSPGALTHGWIGGARHFFVG
jgi:hypothetical protein